MDNPANRIMQREESKIGRCTASCSDRVALLHDSYEHLIMWRDAIDETENATDDETCDDIVWGCSRYTEYSINRHDISILSNELH